MNQRRFPQTRADGSMSVAARFSTSNTAPAQRIQDYVAGWLHGAMATGHVDLLDDLSALPYVVRREQGSLDVVFDAKPGSTRWKDWLVFVTRDLKSSFPDATFECFYDLVADTAHPASLDQERPGS
jgi:hypothetical protein